MSEHTKEPWAIHSNAATHVCSASNPQRGICSTGGYQGKDSFEENEANSQRIVACVNACAPIDGDPAAALQATREALQAALKQWAHSTDSLPLTLNDSCMCSKIAKKHRPCLGCVYHNALALLGEDANQKKAKA